MIQMTNICPYCGEEWWETHECEGTLAAKAEMEKYLEDINDSVYAQAAKDFFETRSSHDAVNHPKHYTSHPSGIECIDVTKHYNFQIGNAMKYLWRQGLKDEMGLDSVEKQIQDCEKAIWYIQSFIDDLKEKRNA